MTQRPFHNHHIWAFSGCGGFRAEMPPKYKESGVSPRWWTRSWNRTLRMPLCVSLSGDSRCSWAGEFVKVSGTPACLSIGSPYTCTGKNQTYLWVSVSSAGGGVVTPHRSQWEMSFPEAPDGQRRPHWISRGGRPGLPAGPRRGSHRPPITQSWFPQGTWSWKELVVSKAFNTSPAHLLRLESKNIYIKTSKCVCEEFCHL